MRNILEELRVVDKYIDKKLYTVADKKIDSIYEELTAGQIHMTKIEEDYMILLLHKLSITLYK